MERLRERARAFGGATVDVALAVLGLALVVVPTAGAVAELLGLPTPALALEFGAVLLSILLAYPFVARQWSTAWLGTYVLGFVGALVGLGAAGAVVSVGLDLWLPGEGAGSTVVLVALAHGGALLATRWSGDRLRRAGPRPDGRTRR